MRAVAIRVALLLILLPSTALADNCSGWTDCYNVFRAALAAMVGLAVLAGLLFLLIAAPEIIIPLASGALEGYGLASAVIGVDPISGEELAPWERALGILGPGMGAARGAASLGRTVRASSGLTGSLRRSIGELEADISKVRNTPLRQTGAGSVVDKADELYEAIRASKTDISEIAASTGLKPANVEKVKNHLFNDSHLLDRYGDDFVGRFDSDPRIAESWQRLRNGSYTSEDIQLLRHETAEGWYMRRHGLSYNAAHEAAQQRYPSPLK